MTDITPQTYPALIKNITQLLEKGRKIASQKVNQILVETYWNIGRYIVEFEQEGEERADYGANLLKKLSKDLNTKFGKGFSKSNLYLMRLFFLAYPKFQTVSGKLSWSHYAELLTISDELSRSFYEKQTIKEKWSVRELKRQRNSSLFERLALSKNKKEVLKLSQDGLGLNFPSDLIKDPYVFEFLSFPNY